MLTQVPARFCQSQVYHNRVTFVNEAQTALLTGPQPRSRIASVQVSARKVGQAAVGKFLVLIGIFIVVIGLVFMLVERFTGGRGLPGDIYYRRNGLVIFIPIVTMILLSLILTLILNLLSRR